MSLVNIQPYPYPLYPDPHASPVADPPPNPVTDPAPQPIDPVES